MATRLPSPLASGSIGLLISILMGSTAFAGQDATPPRPRPAPATKPQAATGWIFEVHAGSMPESVPVKVLESALPPVGGSFPGAGGGTSRIVPSWYFGDGAALANTVATLSGDSGRIVPLDPILTAAAARRKSGGNYGIYVGHSITRHVLLGFVFDQVSGKMALTNDALARLSATNASFKPYFDSVLTRTLTPVVQTTSTLTLEDDIGAAKMFGVMAEVRLMTIRGWTPFVALGGGLVLPSFNSPRAQLVGNYRTTVVNPGVSNNGAVLNETDQVQIRFEAEPTPMNIFGFGVERSLTSHLGIRAGFRTFTNAMLARTRIDTAPVSAVNTSPVAVLRHGVTPALQISTNAAFQTSLSFVGIDHFHSFEGKNDLKSGWAGVFFRF